MINASLTQSKAFEFEGVFWNKTAKPIEELQRAFRIDSGAVLIKTVLGRHHYHCAPGAGF